MLSATFKDKNGTTIYEEQEPMLRASLTKKEKDVNARPLDAQPIRPGETMDFLVRYSQVPSTWNHQAPQVTVTQVTEKK
jgi:hypothetical protein